jgi:hypothetical protein
LAFHAIRFDNRIVPAVTYCLSKKQDSPVSHVGAGIAKRNSMDAHPLEPAHGLWLTASLCRLLGLPLDDSLAERSFPPPWTLATLRGALTELGFKSGYVTPKKGLQGLTLPVVGFLLPASQRQPSPPCAPSSSSAPTQSACSTSTQAPTPLKPCRWIKWKASSIPPS